MLPDHFIIFFAVLLCIFVILFIFNFYLQKNPFQFPHFKHRFDISGKRNVDMNDLIDEFLNQNGDYSVAAEPPVPLK